MLTFKFTAIDDDGYEHEYELPGKYEVCSDCEGHGTHLREGMRGYAYTQEEFEESFDEEEQAEYFSHGGRYDVTCETCHGNRVELVIDEEAIITEEQKEIFTLYKNKENEERLYQQEVDAERRYFGL